ncbi:MAG: competence protein CoiA family protein [Balneola sp.]
MKYGLLDNIKVEATKGIKASCPSCGSELVAKCGELIVHHWAHKAVRDCDAWWETETEWHRVWKDHFPKEWQEIIHKSDNGEKHIADVKTDQGWVVEFQHSYLNHKERQARNKFYSKLIWVVNGMRNDRDFVQFKRILTKHSIRVGDQTLIHLIFPKYCTIKCQLFKHWGNCDSLVFLDFKKDYNKPDSDLWLILPTNTYPESLYLLKKSKKEIIEYLIDGRIEKWHEKHIQRIGKRKSLISYLRSLQTIEK